MIHNFNRNIDETVEHLDNKGMHSLYKNFELLTYSKQRLNNMLLNKCSEQVNLYSNCIGNPDWKNDMGQFVNKDSRKNCFDQFVNLKRCSLKNIGESYTLRLEALNQTQRSNEYREERTLNLYNNLIKNQMNFLKTDMPVEGEEESSD